MSHKNSYYRPLLLLLLLTTVFRLVYVNFIELAQDEAYYWDLSRTLQLSYYDHPPMIMYLISLFTKVFGNTEFAVRLSPIIIAGAITILVYLIGKEMFDDYVGFYSALLVNITLIYSVGSILATIDTPFALFWLSAVYSCVKAIKTGDGKWWYISGIAVGLGLLSKYVMVLFVPALFIFLLLSREHRRWLKRKEPYIGGVMALLIFSPVIIWNAQNEWLSFKFQLAHGLKTKKAAGLLSFMKYIGGQAAVLSPFLFLACIWGMAKGLIVWIRDKDWRYLFLTSFAAFVVVFFGYSSLKAKVEGNWPMPAYFTAVIACVALYSKSNYNKKRLLAVIVAGTAFLLTAFAHVQAISPVISLKSDSTNELHGWKQLGKEVGDTLELFPKDLTKEPFILADSLQLTAELAFYIPSHPKVYEIAGRGRLSQYNLWPPPETGSDAVMIADPGVEKDPYISSLFEDIREIKRIEIGRGDKVIRIYSLFFCRNFRGFKG